MEVVEGYLLGYRLKGLWETLREGFKDSGSCLRAEEASFLSSGLTRISPR